MRSWSRLETSSSARMMRSSRSAHLAWRASLSAGMRTVAALLATRVEARLEQLHQVAGDVDVVAQRVLDVVLRERRAALAHVLGVGAQQRRLAPGQPGREDERVEAVALVVAVPHRRDGVLEQLARVVGHRRGGSAARSRRCRTPAPGPRAGRAARRRPRPRWSRGSAAPRTATAAARSGRPSAGPRRAARRRPRRARAPSPRRPRSARAGRGRPRRSAAGSPPCRPPGSRRRRSARSGCPAPRRTSRSPRW